MDNQVIFTKVIQHLMRQGVCAIDDTTGNCRYRGNGGSKCAVGYLIPDSDYNPEMEG